MSDKAQNREVSLDSLFSGRLDCYQYENGYRFSIDSVLVSHFVSMKPGELILDIGSGCGIIGLIILYRHGNVVLKVTGLEKQGDLVSIGRKNIAINHFDKNFDMIEGDATEVKNLFRAETFSVVISNPPFFQQHSGRLSRDDESRAARHQEEATLETFIHAAAYCLRNRGRFATIYPAGSLTELLLALKKKNIEPKRIRFVYPYPEYTFGAKLVLVEGIKNGGEGVRIEPPLYVHQFKNGPHSREIMKMYEY